MHFQLRKIKKIILKILNIKECISLSVILEKIVLNENSIK